MPDKEKVIAGNNRFTKDTEQYYSFATKNSDILLYGIGREKYSEYVTQKKIIGAGYKMFILRYGLVLTLAVLGAYLLFASSSVNKKTTYFFVMLQSIYFLALSLPFAAYWLIPLIFSVRIGKFNLK